jgi:hypothetical protein
MDDKIVKKHDGIAVFQKLEKFQKMLNSKPKPSDIKINKLARNSKFIPIGIIEKTLDEIFSGLWEAKNFKYIVVVNELVGDLELSVFHPVIQEWITRPGTAGLPITTKTKTDFTDIKNKQINACVTVTGHLKSECIKNAAKSFGEVFGRNLNRDDDYSSYTSLSERLISDEQYLDIEEKLAMCTTKEEVILLFDNYSGTYKRDFNVRRLFIDRQKELPKEK